MAEENIKRFRLIACEIFYREVNYCIAHAPHVVDVIFMPKALHDIGKEKMMQRLQEEIDSTDKFFYDALLLGYGLCNHGTVGLHASLPMIIPRAHDCIAILMGSAKTYKHYFDSHQGTYFLSCGWIERGLCCGNNPESVTSQLGISCNYEDYVKLYGEENAAFLYETLGQWTAHYCRYAYINNGLGNVNYYRGYARQKAREQQWEYEEIPGSLCLFEELVSGCWDEERFLIIPPGKEIKPSYDEKIIKTE